MSTIQNTGECTAKESQWHLIVFGWEDILVIIQLNWNMVKSYWNRWDLAAHLDDYVLLSSYDLQMDFQKAHKENARLERHKESMLCHGKKS